MTARCRNVRAVTVSASGRIGNARRTVSTPSGAMPWSAASWISSPSNVETTLTSAAHSFSARSPMMSNTGCTSVCDLLITRRIALVAVCCSRASVRSRFRASSSVNSLTFSTAMTAWSAKVVSSSICVSVKGIASTRTTLMAPIAASPRSIGTDTMLR